MHKTTEEFASVWPDMIRGLSVLCVMVHHWFLFLPGRSGYAVLSESVEFVQTLCGTFLQLFFVISGYGLAISYLDSTNFSWSSWVSRRIRRILIPYWIVITATFLLVNLAHFVFSQQFTDHFSLSTLFCYVTFTRNYYPPCWGFNPTLWFMPVILGLYMLFPLLLWLLHRFRVQVFLLLAILITCGFIFIFSLFGYEISHDSALPFFFISPFAIGMAMAFFITRQVHFLARMSSIPAFFIGFSFYFSSWMLAKIWDQGSIYNDVLTAGGLFLICLPICKLIYSIFRKKVAEILIFLSKLSYLMYLLHGAFILYFAKPVLKFAFPYNFDLSMIICLLGLYILSIIMIAKVLCQTIKSLSVFLSNQYLSSRVAQRAATGRRFRG